MDVANPAYDGPGSLQPKLIKRDYGFGTSGTVRLGGQDVPDDQLDDGHDHGRGADRLPNRRAVGGGWNAGVHARHDARSCRRWPRQLVAGAVALQCRARRWQEAGFALNSLIQVDFRGHAGHG